MGTLTANVSELVALVAALVLGRAWAGRSGLPVLVFADVTDVIMQGADMISISDRENIGGAYGSACGCRRAERDRSGHVAVDGSVSARIGNVTVEGGD